MEAAPYTSGQDQSPFLFYNPGPYHPQGHHAHFTPHPQQQPYHAPVHFHPDMIKPMPHPMYFHQPPPLPQHSMEIPAYMYQHSAYPHGHMLTPVASPQPIYPKPSIVIETQAPRYYHHELDSGPSTPPLSSSCSSAGSPSPRSMLPTPANEPATYGFPSMTPGFKQGHEMQSLTLLGESDEIVSPQLRPGMSSDSPHQLAGQQKRATAKCVQNANTCILR